MHRLFALLVVLLVLAGVMWKSENAATPAPMESPPAKQELESAPTVPDVIRPPLQRLEEVVKPEEEAPLEEEFVEWEEAKPEPVEQGESALELRFFDAATQLPVSGTVQLWRLQVAESETWSAGDQLQFQGEAVDGRLLVKQLPEGAYRTYALFALDSTGTEEAFLVEGESTFMERFVTIPAEEGIYLRLFSAAGMFVRSTPDALITMKTQGSSSQDFFQMQPPWIKERRPKGNFYTEASAMGGSYGRRMHQTWKELEAFFDGFYLGSLKQDHRQSQRTFHFRIRQGEDQAILVDVHPSGTGAYVAVFLTYEEVEERLVFPAGMPPHDLRSDLSITASGLAVGQGSGGAQGVDLVAGEAWRDAKVKIRLQSKEFLEWEITWSPSDGPLPDFQLQLRE